MQPLTTLIGMLDDSTGITTQLQKVMALRKEGSQRSDSR